MVKFDDGYDKYQVTVCAPPEWCLLTGEDACVATKDMFESSGDGIPLLKNCSTSCSPEPKKRKISVNTLSCDTCLDNGYTIKTDCVKRKCPPLFTKCQQHGYTLKGMSPNGNITVKVSAKSCATPTQCNVDAKEMQEFIQGEFAEFVVRDAIINDFSMQCKSSAACMFQSVVVFGIACLLSIFGN